MAILKKKACDMQKPTKAVKPKQKSAKKTEKRPYVRYSTVWGAVGGGLSNPGEAKICNVGTHKVLLTRSEKLNSYGNPVHTATVINPDGSTGSSSRGTGNATLIVSQALKKSGIDTKYPNRKKQN